MLTVVAAAWPVVAVMPPGNVPKPRRIDSPSSSTVSWAAVTVNVFDVSAAPKVTLVGTPE